MIRHISRFLLPLLLVIIWRALLGLWDRLNFPLPLG